MKTTRQSNANYWINFGKRAAASGYSIQWTINPIKPENTQVVEWLKQGHAAETASRAKKGITA